MQSQLRTSPRELPDHLAALSLTETPVIDDDPDPDIGLFWRLPRTGVEIRFHDGRVSTVFLYGRQKDGLHVFAGKLPFDLAWDMNFETVLRDRGEPSRMSHGSDSSTAPLGAVPPWVRYDGEAYCMHVQFRADKSAIEIVSIMIPERAP